MPHMDEADLVLPFAQRLHDAVDAVAGEAKDDFNTPIVNRLNKNVGCGHFHGGAPRRSAMSVLHSAAGRQGRRSRAFTRSWRASISPAYSESCAPHSPSA